MTEIFPFYGQGFYQWCVRLISDEGSTNLRIASVENNNYVGCNSHKLNIEVNHMLTQNQQIQSTLDCVHETIRDAKRLKLSALLRNLTDLKPIMRNETRWSGKIHML